jgi:hypothetical protein
VRREEGRENVTQIDVKETRGAERRKVTGGS